MVHASAFFNNKGGVGKTTSIANLGARLAFHGHTVVVVDLDPQCNMTQYFLSDDEWEDLYIDTAKSADGTVWNYVRPISQSKNIESDDSVKVPLLQGRFGFQLVPGHPFVSRLDDSLAEAWGNLRLARVGGIEATYWCQLLIEKLEREVPDLDYVLFDLGPSLGPLNRSVLLACDSFIAPVSPDLFSLYSFDNLKSWFATLQRALEIAKMMVEDESEDYKEAWWFKKFRDGVSVRSIGYISQQYVTRTTRGERRQTKAYSRFLKEMPAKAGDLAAQLHGDVDVLGVKGYEIGVMPHMYSMVSLAHEAHAPVADLTSADGLNGAQFRQRDRYVEDMDNICNELVDRMESIDA